jgi:hypothetical protein
LAPTAEQAKAEAARLLKQHVLEHDARDLLLAETGVAT